MDLLNQARSAAEEGPTQKKDETEYVFGPVPVGNIGTVGVIEREFNGRTFPYARFVPRSGRPSNLSLAACDAIIRALDEAAASEAPEAEAEAPSE